MGAIVTRRRRRTRGSVPGWLVALILLALLAGGLWLGDRWLKANPQHDPRAPFSMNDPIGWATARKLARLREDPAACVAALRDAGIRVTSLAPEGRGQCRKIDRLRLPDGPIYNVRLAPSPPVARCVVNASLLIWLDRRVQAAAFRHFGKPVARVEHLGTENCRTIAGTAQLSEHATGGAIDIAGFVLEGGRRVTLLRDWNSDDPATRAFLREARDGACDLFATTLSPDYNRAHADHFHLDVAARGGYRVCR